MEQHDFDFSNMKDHDANHNAIEHPENSAEYASLTVNKGVAQPPLDILRTRHQRRRSHHHSP